MGGIAGVMGLGEDERSMKDSYQRIYALAEPQIIINSQLDIQAREIKYTKASKGALPSRENCCFEMVGAGCVHQWEEGDELW